MSRKLQHIKNIFNNFENDEKKRELAVYFFTGFGILSLSIFGINGIIEGETLYSVVVGIFWLISVSSMIYLKKTKDVKTSAFIITSLLFIFELAILVNLGKHGTGIYWFYVFPLVSVFMLGNKKGTIFSVSLILIASYFIKFPLKIFENTYNPKIIFRFVFIYLIVLGLVNIFEYMRIAAQKAFLKTNKKLKESNEEAQALNEELRQSNEEMLAINNALSEKQIKIEQQKNELEEKNKHVMIINNDLLLQKAFIEEQAAKLQQANDEAQETNKILKEQHKQMQEINNSLQEKQRIIEKQNKELEKTLEIVTQQQEKLQKINKNVQDSINYARTIQEALITRKETLDQLFSDYFVLFKPKELVSGDFYYANKVGDHIIFAVADCTGHGVPGGFLTMLGITYLHGAIRRQEANSVSEALDILRARIKDIFVQFGNRNQNGLDIALCAIDTKTKILQYAGAYNPLIIIRNEQILEYKATRNPIGWYPKEKPFTKTEIQLEKNDVIYLFSDGYADQLGGTKFKKFTSKRFKELLLQIHSLPMQTQKEMLDTIITNWRGNYDQVDDITVMGVKLN